jgi:hypothetical protein
MGYGVNCGTVDDDQAGLVSVVLTVDLVLWSQVLMTDRKK